MQNPLPLALLVLIYMFIVSMGRKWMEHRQPLQIDPIIIAYNLMQIVVNSAMVLAVNSAVEFTLSRMTRVNNDICDCFLSFRLFVTYSFLKRILVFDANLVPTPPISTECL